MQLPFFLLLPALFYTAGAAVEYVLLATATPYGLPPLSILALGTAAAFGVFIVRTDQSLTMVRKTPGSTIHQRALRYALLLRGAWLGVLVIYVLYGLGPGLALLSIGAVSFVLVGYVLDDPEVAVEWSVTSPGYTDGLPDVPIGWFLLVGVVALGGLVYEWLVLLAIVPATSVYLLGVALSAVGLALLYAIRDAMVLADPKYTARTRVAAGWLLPVRLGTGVLAATYVLFGTLPFIAFSALGVWVLLGWRATVEGQRAASGITDTVDAQSLSPSTAVSR